MKKAQWQLDTTEAPASVIARLREHVDPVPSLPVFRAPGRRAFLGVVWNDAFEIRRREWFGKNDFGAILRAKVRATPTGSVVTGSIGPEPMLKVMFWLFVSLGLALSLAGAILALILTGPGRFVLAIVGLGFLILGPGVCGLFLMVSASERSQLI